MKLSSALLFGILFFIPHAQATDWGCLLPSSYTQINPSLDDVEARIKKLKALNNELTDCLKRREPVVVVATATKIECFSVASSTLKFQSLPVGEPVSVYYNEKGGDILFSKEAQCKSGEVEQLDKQVTGPVGATGVCRDFGSGRAPSNAYLNYIHVGKEKVKTCNQSRAETAGGKHGNKNHPVKPVIANHQDRKPGIPEKTYENGKITGETKSGNQ